MRRLEIGPAGTYRYEYQACFVDRRESGWLPMDDAGRIVLGDQDHDRIWPVRYGDLVFLAPGIEHVMQSTADDDPETVIVFALVISPGS